MQETVAQGLTGRALGEAVIDHVLTFPEQHDQGDVVCGSAACIAGWTVLIHHGFGHAFDLESAYFSMDCGISSFEHAAALLGVNEVAFEDTVYGQMDESIAISNFKHLLDEAHSENAS